MDERSLHVLKSEGEKPRTGRRLRIAIAGFCALLLFTIVASVHLSTLDVSYGTLVFGPASLWRNHAASFPVAAFEPRGIDLV
ncbi:MAG: hypothetical protein HYZ27_11810, partial [Deltaproteobacteria bacterium]|nr:hypothetical protein [Deltaproteobacteria bacterium]